VSSSTSPISIDVDATNPGQFFACCGLLELADRLWPGAEGWFEPSSFQIFANGELPDLVHAVSTVELVQVDLENDTSSAIQINAPPRANETHWQTGAVSAALAAGIAQFRPIRLDWWQDDRAGGKQLKVWAGTMESVRIARAMQRAMCDNRFVSSNLLNVGLIAYDPANPEKKVEPYYFDARRAPNAHSRDVGFSPNDLQLTTTAFPAVEFLCIVGLQRCLPAPTRQPRVFDYYSWAQPLAPELLPAAITGEMGSRGARGYRFENWYRTGQRKHKAFRSAIPLS
jgi:CRISPR-associated protein Csb3